MSAKPKSALSAPALVTASPADVLDVTIASNRIAANAKDANPYQVRNSLLLQKAKARVRYEKGITLPTAAVVLLANANRREYNHRRTLSRNIVAATSQSRPANTCAHHIVALHDQEAALSRSLLFRWGIGINDADNGVFLPRTGRGMPGYPDAVHHTPHHNPTYHLAVYDQLRDETEAIGGRKSLRSIKGQLLSGTLSL
ncbi:AHH domain-containing protein [Dyella sp.]|uniref:AHH domain-containing protein n=1 Tax=Dyella sp. TaxID=1869338 RepID=UPI002D779F96|nr:AHH domain-containing protein [Dyella sp.]HET7332493.1 AHH domain-containing protein [Dyella sp.]